MTAPARIYDGDGFRRIRPNERSPGLTELRLANGRCIAAIGFGPAVDAIIQARAAGAPPHSAASAASPSNPAHDAGCTRVRNRGAQPRRKAS